jgi:SAM-dependent methyltransferase
MMGGGQADLAPHRAGPGPPPRTPARWGGGVRGGGPAKVRLYVSGVVVRLHVSCVVVRICVSCVAAAVIFMVVEAGLQARLHAQAPAAGRHGRLFPPEDLGLLEGPDRAAWQKPDQIMDALAIADGSAVADIGAGAGWFTIHLARRVGPNGKVYSQDVQRPMLEAIRRRVAREGLQNVETRLGAIRGAPNLPDRSLDAVLVVDVYPEVEDRDRVTFLRNLAAALKPGGRIGIVNYKPGRGGPGPAPEEGVRVDSASVEGDAHAAGLRVLARQTLPYQYLLVLGQ